MLVNRAVVSRRRPPVDRGPATTRMPRRTVSVPDEVWDPLSELAWRNDRSVAEEVRQALRAALDRDARRRTTTGRAT